MQTSQDKRLSVEDARIALGETNPALRSAFMSVFTRMGFHDIQLCKDSAAVLSHLESGIVDLVVVADDLPGLDFREMVQVVRQGHVGCNPFTLIMATVNDMTVEDIRRIAAAGVDRVAMKPLSLGAISGRIEAMTKRRRPFISTRNYLGPCRRAARRGETKDGIALDVPNTLWAKTQKRFTPGLLQGQIDDGMKRLRDQRAINGCLALAHVLGEMSERMIDLRENAAISEGCAKIIEICREVEDCYSGTLQDHLADLADGLASLGERLERPTLDQTRLVAAQIFVRVADVFRRAAQIEPESSSAVRAIARSVQSFAFECA